MGNYNTRSIKFKQSVADFPLTVALGEKVPAWGLSRWAGNGGLRFVPPDDEGFTLRGDKQRLVYKGRRRFHRFTILGDGAFEYDCILLREPENNVIALRMEGAEQFDFFRQPDFVHDPFLKGSYAVYKKETLLGEGTGKLCHIHRPEIIDAMGRRCWGLLAVVGNELRITIPEQWLAEAKYPVIVDPTIGTTAVGSQYLVEYDPPDDPWTSLMFEGAIPVNRFLVNEAINGNCTAYFYTNEDDSDAGGKPVIYTDNGNKPQNRKSKQEQWIDFRVTGSKPKGWRSGTFATDGSIGSGSYIWFGCFNDFFWFPRFDYGAKCYCDSWWDNTDSIPNSYPVYNVNWYENFKLSMYFTYTSAQNYVRTLTQGVDLTDTQKKAQTFKRATAQTVKVTQSISRFETFLRQCLQDVSNCMSIARHPVFSRSVNDEAGITDSKKHNRGLSRNCEDTAGLTAATKKQQDFIRSLGGQDVNVSDIKTHTADYKRKEIETVQGSDVGNAFVSFFRQCVITVSNSAGVARLQDFFRSISSQAGIAEALNNNRELSRKCEETATANSEAKRSQGFLRIVDDNVKGTDVSFYPVLFVRNIQETQGITDTIRLWGEYIRGLYDEAGNVAETAHVADYCRTESDTVQAEGSVLRSVAVFIRIFTTSLVRDFIIRRFLVAREELVLKSCITRELTLESQIN